MKKYNKKGFTLIELLAVIVILAILATAAFTLLMPTINKNRAKTFLSDVNELSSAFENAKFGEEAPASATISSKSCTYFTVSSLISKGFLKVTGAGKAGIVAQCGNEYYVAYSNGTYKTTDGKLVNIKDYDVSSDGTPVNFIADSSACSETVSTYTLN